MSLRKAATSGMIWTFMDTVVARGTTIVASILLARLLSPRDFGLMGMIYIFTSISSALIDSGLTSSLIRDNNVDDDDYNTVFWSNIVFSFLIYLILFFLSPYIAIFYEEELLINVIRVYSLIFIFGSLVAVQIAILSKKLEFKKLMLLNLPGVIIGSLVGIIFAYLDFQYWSIIVMQLSTQGIYVLFVWFTAMWTPKFFFSRSTFKKHFNFGYKIALISIFSTFFDNIYNVMIGKFYSVNQLGQFDRARTFNNYPVGILTSIITKVSYPLLSNIQDDKSLMHSAYKKIIQLTFFISLPLMAFLSVVSYPLIILVLGNEWQSAAVFFQILCAAGVLYPLNAFNMNILKVFGRSDWLLKNEVIKKLIMAALIGMAFPFGIIFLVWSLVIFSIIALVINAYYTDRLIDYSLFRQIKDSTRTIYTGIIAYGISWFLFSHLQNQSEVLQILLPFTIGYTTFLIMNFILKNEALLFVIDLIKINK